MVSDNPWCSLWVPSSQSWTSKITLIFSCLHIHEWTSLTKPDFQQKQLKFNKLLKSATTDQLAASLLGLCEHFEGIWNNYIDIELKIMQVIFIFFLSTWGYNSLAIRPGSTKFERKYFYKLIRSKRLTACVLAASTKQKSTIQRIKPNLTWKWPKWNEIACWIWLWLYQEH